MAEKTCTTCVWKGECKRAEWNAPCATWDGATRAIARECMAGPEAAE